LQTRNSPDFQSRRRSDLLAVSNVNLCPPLPLTRRQCTNPEDAGISDFFTTLNIALIFLAILGLVFGCCVMRNSKWYRKRFKKNRVGLDPSDGYPAHRLATNPSMRAKEADDAQMKHAMAMSANSSHAQGGRRGSAGNAADWADTHAPEEALLAATATKSRWQCPSCAFVNSRHMPFCELCHVARDTDAAQKLEVLAAPANTAVSSARGSQNASPQPPAYPGGRRSVGGVNGGSARATPNGPSRRGSCADLVIPPGATPDVIDAIKAAHRADVAEARRIVKMADKDAFDMATAAMGSAAAADTKREAKDAAKQAKKAKKKEKRERRASLSNAASPDHSRRNLTANSDTTDDGASDDGSPAGFDSVLPVPHMSRMPTDVELGITSEMNAATKDAIRINYQSGVTEAREEDLATRALQLAK
jgi:hypothetical protein